MAGDAEGHKQVDGGRRLCDCRGPSGCRGECCYAGGADGCTGACDERGFTAYRVNSRGELECLGPVVAEVVEVDQGVKAC